MQRDLLQSPQRFLGRKATGLQAKARIVFQQPVNEVVVLVQRRHLKGGHPLDSDDDRLAVAKLAVIAQARLGLTQWNYLHGDP